MQSNVDTVKVPADTSNTDGSKPSKHKLKLNRKMLRQGGLIPKGGNKFTNQLKEYLAEQGLAMQATDENGNLTPEARRLRNRAKRARKEVVVWVRL